MLFINQPPTVPNTPGKIEAPAPSVGEALAMIYATNTNDTHALSDARALARRAFMQEYDRTLYLFVATGEHYEGFITYYGNKVLHEPGFATPTTETTWQNYVAPEIKAIWELLPPDARAGFYLTALRTMQAEEKAAERLLKTPLLQFHGLGKPHGMQAQAIQENGDFYRLRKSRYSFGHPILNADTGRWYCSFNPADGLLAGLSAYYADTYKAAKTACQYHAIFKQWPDPERVAG